VGKITLPATLPNPAKSVASGKTSRQSTWFVLYLVASTILLALDIYTPIEQVEWLLNVPLVWIVVVACTPTQLTWAGAFASLCIMVGGILSPPGPVDIRFFFTTRAIVIVTIWLIVLQSRRRAEAEAKERRALLAQHEQELKTLRGMIPICAWCKRIRTDSGVWKQIEQYIHEHSGADFTHSVCPECVSKLEGQELCPPPSSAP
jgi:uncharacterized membrane protein